MTFSTPARSLRPGRRRLGRLGAAVVAAATLALAGTAAGCSEAEDKGGTTAAAQADRVGVSDVWVKAAPSGMTAAFGTLVNEGGAEVRLESVTTDLAARVELHETVSDGAGGMTMRPKEGGFTIAAGKSHELAPGGDHIMMMDLSGPAVAGDEVELVLLFADGSTETVTALIKDFTGADEKYTGSGTGGTSGGMNDMSGMDGTDGAS